MIRNSKPLIIAFGVFLFLAVIQVISYVSGCRFFLNLTGSEPRGVYLQRAFYGTLHRGDLVFMKCPPGFEKFVYGRKWLPNEWPLLKTVRGVPGDSFCVSKLMFLLEIKGSGRFFLRQAGPPIACPQGLPDCPGEAFPADCHGT